MCNRDDWAIQLVKSELEKCECMVTEQFDEHCFALLLYCEYIYKFASLKFKIQIHVEKNATRKCSIDSKINNMLGANTPIMLSYLSSSIPVFHIFIAATYRHNSGHPFFITAIYNVLMIRKKYQYAVSQIYSVKSDSDLKFFLDNELIQHTYLWPILSHCNQLWDIKYNVIENFHFMYSGCQDAEFTDFPDNTVPVIANMIEHIVVVANNDVNEISKWNVVISVFERMVDIADTVYSNSTYEKVYRNFWYQILLGQIYLLKKEYHDSIARYHNARQSLLFFQKDNVEYYKKSIDKVIKQLTIKLDET